MSLIIFFEEIKWILIKKRLIHNLYVFISSKKLGRSGQNSYKKFSIDINSEKMIDNFCKFVVTI